MAWPADPVHDSIIEASFIAEIIDAIALWGGNVNAGGYTLTNLGNVTLASTATIQRPAWNIATLENGWANAMGGLVSLRYRKDPLNNLIIQGSISGGTIADGTVVTTLAAGYFNAGKHIPFQIRGGFFNALGTVTATGTVTISGVADGTILHFTCCESLDYP